MRLEKTHQVSTQNILPNNLGNMFQSLSMNLLTYTLQLKSSLVYRRYVQKKSTNKAK